MVGELVYHFKFVVADGDDSWCVHVLAQQVGLLRADSKPERISSSDTVDLAQCVRWLLRHRRRVWSYAPWFLLLAWWRCIVCHRILCACPHHRLNSQKHISEGGGEEDAEEGWSKDTALLHAAFDIERFENAAFVLDGCLNAIIKRSVHAVSFGRHPIFRRMSKSPSRLTKVEGLGQIYQGDVEGLLLFPTLLL